MSGNMQTSPNSSSPEELDAQCASKNHPDAARDGANEQSSQNSRQDDLAAANGPKTTNAQNSCANPKEESSDAPENMDSGSFDASERENTDSEPKAEDNPPTKDSQPEQDGQAMGLLDHLNELRGRLIKSVIAVAAGFGLCWAFVDYLFNILVTPLLSALPSGANAQYTTLPEAFFTRVQIAFVAGLFVASPVIFYQIWAFVSPGLYDEEKRHIVPLALLSAIFFIGGACFCYFIVFPYAFNFFISYSTPEILVTPKISDYISFVLKLLFAFGLIFEMPIFTFFLARLGILTASAMRKGRKYAIVGIFIIAAILTPPDVVSQLLMACPMLALYELSIGIAALFGKKRSKIPSETEEENTA